MADAKELLGPLREADALMAQARLSPAARSRIRAALDRRPRRALSRLLPVLGFACGIAVAIAWMSWRASTAPAPTVPVASGFAWNDPSCSATSAAMDAAGAPITRLEGVCHLRIARGGITLSSRGSTQVIETSDGIRVLRGNVELEIDHVAQGRAPVRVAVSAGTIEVIGTRFVVHQDDDRGHVDLLEGTIRFVALDGTTTAITPGNRFAWIDPPSRTAATPLPHEPPTRPTPSKRSPRATEPVDSAAVERIHALRAERKYGEALELVKQLRSRHHDRRIAEILSFEQGDLLEISSETEAACAHWRQHAKTFVRGMFEAAVADAIARLRCEP